jgi:hypothetical protein
VLERSPSAFRSMRSHFDASYFSGLEFWTLLDSPVRRLAKRPDRAATKDWRVGIADRDETPFPIPSRTRNRPMVIPMIDSSKSNALKVGPAYSPVTMDLRKHAWNQALGGYRHCNILLVSRFDKT